jgi:hypothetical protein
LVFTIVLVLRSIKFKTVLDLLIVSLIPMALAAFLASGKGRDELTRSSEENLQLLASVTSARLDQLLIDASRVVRIVAADE